MSESVRENLLGYLLDALEPEEAEQVHQALQQTPRLNAELESLAAHLAELEFDRDLHHPPPGLAANTCRWLALPIEGARSAHSHGIDEDWELHAVVPRPTDKNAEIVIYQRKQD